MDWGGVANRVGAVGTIGALSLEQLLQIGAKLQCGTETSWYMCLRTFRNHVFTTSSPEERRPTTWPILLDRGVAPAVATDPKAAPQLIDAAGFER